MTRERLDEITRRYPTLRIAVLGDFSLDRYLEIDPARAEVSIETGLPVHNVINVRAQPGAAGTVLNNLVALGVGTIFPIGFCGEDGEGFELRRALASMRGVQLDHFITTPLRRTFTYAKPLVLHPTVPPQELNRLDTKNWSETPTAISELVIESLRALATTVDAVIVMDQVDLPETGTVTTVVRESLTSLPSLLPVIADSRRGLREYPPVVFKMNAAELGALTGTSVHSSTPLDVIASATTGLAQRNGHPVIVTLAERGIIAAESGSVISHIPALALRGPIDIVGAGDSVTANITAALASQGTLAEAIEMAALASSIVIHQLGTTGTANVEQIARLNAAN